MSDSIQQDLSKIFVYGQVSELLNQKDKKRVIAILQNDPNYYLSLLNNIEMTDLYTKFKSNPKKLIDELNKISNNDNMFREISAFMHDTNDMLSIGSFVMGEKKGKEAKIGQIIDFE